MKSFGVRLAAGAVTILFGAYAAAIAQKDRQDESDSWNAETPALADPASPIAVLGDDSWLKQPAAKMGAESVPSEFADGTYQPAGSVQLIQHTEQIDDDKSPNMPTFGSAPPGSLGLAPHQAAGESAAPDMDWMMPDPSTATVDAADVGPAMSMTFPGPADAASGPSAGDMPAMEFYPSEKINTDGQSLQAASDEPSFSAGPAIAAGAGIAGVAIAASGGDSAAPTNLLRGSPDGSNVLRGQADVEMSNEAEFFHESDSDGDSVLHAEAPYADSQYADSPYASAPQGDAAPSTFAQEAPQMDAAAYGHGGLAQDAIGLGGAVPTAGLGVPQANGMPASSFASPNDYGQSNGYQGNGRANGQDRMASLPRQSPASMNALQGDYQPSAMAQPRAAVAIDPSITLDSPGERRLEGAQTPSVIIQKRAPAEVKVGKPAAFVVHVQNVGSVEALNVEVHDRIPAGMRLVDASPSPIQQQNMLMWELGSMPAGDERTITMQLIPEQEGELGSVARVSFEAAASVRTISTRPELKIVQRIPEQGVLIGQQLEIELEISNPGSGAATGVVLQEDVPEGLEHPKGRQLDNALGTLAPGEVRRQVLRLRAVKAGVIQNTIRLAGDDGLAHEHTVAIQVIAPDLQIELTGPSKRFLERQATYQLNLANNGTADATNVEISVQLDRGFTFVSTEKEGQYDPSRHAVFWSLAQMPAGVKGSVPLTLLPIEAGEQAIKLEARADLGILTRSERTMSVEGFAELSFAISNPGGPIEVGALTDYEVVVSNSGSKPDTNVRVQLQLPQGLELVSTADGQAGHDGRGLVAFQPKSQLAPGEQLKYSLRVRGVAQGTHIVRAIVVSDHSTVPVTKEESTRVYADQ